MRGGHDWSLWDLWFCVAEVRDHDGDLGGIAPVLIESIRHPTFGNSGPGEAKLSHLHDLQGRLDSAGMVPADLADVDVLADKAISKRAREKVSGRISLEHRACTPAMLDTPRRRLEHRARYGHWKAFRSDPAPFSEKFRPTVDRKDFVSKGKTCSIASHLDKRLADLDGPRRSLDVRLALYRAFHTAGLEIADAADDSYGTIGETRTTPAARRLGSRAWRPIEAMARSNLKAKDHDGAIAVFRAADQPGWHQDHLREKCLELTGIDLAAATAPGGFPSTARPEPLDPR